MRDSLGTSCGVDQDTTLGIVSCDLAEGFAQSLMELDVLALEAIGRAVATPGGRPFHPDLGGNVEDDREIRLEIADRHPLHRIEHVGRDLALAALVGPRRIEE